MDLLIRSARIIDPHSPHHSQTKDILIVNGKIESVAEKITNPKKVQEFVHKGLHVSPGWFDGYASFGDPGFEYKEDLDSGMKAAAQGGFTGVAIRPDTSPPLQSKGQIEYVLKKTRQSVVNVHPVGAVSQNLEGKEIPEMYDMKEAGAVAFSNGDVPLSDSGLMLRALQYVLPFNGLIMNVPLTPSISSNGLLNEGKMSVQLGMAGNPAISEELMVNRDINLAEYTGSRLLLVKVSTERSVKLIREAKRKGVKVFAAVSVYHLLLNEEMLDGYDSNLKVTPPLRTKADIRALIRGIEDGTIDIICSDHSPQDIESKRKEFEYAENGMISLESAFGMLNTALRGKIKLERIVEAIAIQSRKVFGLEVPSVAKGQSADLTLFDPKMKWTFSEEHIRSKSRNTPVLGHEFMGKPLAIVNNNKFVKCA